MSSEGKIKSKDLSYEATLPPFLQRLHDQKAGRGDQDQHERPIARPKRVKTHDEDDEPTVVDDSGETVSKEDLEKMTAAGNGEAEEGGNVTSRSPSDAEPKASGAIQDDSVPKVDQKVTDGTATKKRKMAKVVGDGTNSADNKEDEAMKKIAKKVKKKAKPIKLAFDDENET